MIDGFIQIMFSNGVNHINLENPNTKFNMIKL